MNKTQYQTAIGGLLHDIGKIVYRSGDRRSHSESGYAFLREAGVADDAILQQVRLHHADSLKDASLPDDSLAYITYIADNIASAADRRKEEGSNQGFARDLPQDSVFNRLNDNEKAGKYAPKLLSESEDLNFPTEKAVAYDRQFYVQCLRSVQDNLRGFCLSEQYVNSLLEILEAHFTYVPSSTSLEETADISLFDHCKLTAALGGCILEYLNDRKISDYRTALWKKAEEFYAQKAFLLYSMDLSGIQDFIYTITSDGALKALRARSFYLELLMEHLVDTILQQAGFSRANCLYTGGGHAYLLLANTEATRGRIQAFEQSVNQWMMKQFGTALYLSGGYAPCSADNLKNEPRGSYREIFQTISAEISAHKLRRYSAAEIAALNQASRRDELRECAVCHRTDRLTEEGKCAVCAGLEAFSKEIQTKAFFAVTKERPKTACLPLPGDAWLTAETKDSLMERMEQDMGYQRSYSKNISCAGRRLAARLWVGDYQKGGSFQELAAEAEGVRRLAVLRADIDNLGQAFVRGFESKKHGQKYVTLSRTATFSRSLSLFFKHHINQMLAKGRYSLLSGGEGPIERDATVVYSGGDDVFIIGAWDDIVGFAVDLHDDLSSFTQDALTISAGIGLYPEKYPVSAMARETGELEECSKARPGKSAVALFDENNVYSWDTFINNVLEEKYVLLRDFFSAAEDHGKSFLYRLLELMRGSEEKINLARYAYLLARMEPKGDASEGQKELYRDFARKMYEWMQDPEQRRQTITAIYIYIYMIREGEQNGEENGD